MESGVSCHCCTPDPLGAYRFDTRVDLDRGTANQAQISNTGVTGPPRLSGNPVNAGDTWFRDMDQSPSEVARKSKSSQSYRRREPIWARGIDGPIF